MTSHTHDCHRLHVIVPDLLASSLPHQLASWTEAAWSPFPPRLPERPVQQGGGRPSPQPSLESLFAKRFINWDTVIGNVFCSQDTSSWIREKRYNAHKRDFMKGNKNAKCQIREPLHRRGEICAGPYNRGREKGGWYTWNRGPCELRCAG